jgi:hypothetical protein
VLSVNEWVPLGAAAVALASFAGTIAALFRSPWRASAVASRVQDLERAFPAWHAEMSKLATAASEAYALARTERERVQGMMGGLASGEARRSKREPTAEEIQAAEEARIAALPPSEQRRARIAQIARRFS